ncbi:MAG: VWA-like domain-containing protein [Candidatus Bathyarchaeia archaeon]
MDAKQFLEELRDIRVFCSRYFPFVIVPLNYVRIVSSKAVPIAAVDENNTLIINLQAWEKLSLIEKRFVIIHEMLHVCLLHALRSKGFLQIAHNIASDGKINDGIEESNVINIHQMNIQPITLNVIADLLNNRVSYEDLKKMSTEEIASILERSSISLKLQALNVFLKSDLTGKIEPDEVIQEGSFSPNADKTEKEKAWRQIANKAKDFAQNIGVYPASLSRLVDEVIEYKPPWQILTRFGSRGLRHIDPSFMVLSRRGDDYPGSLKYSSTTWCLIDTSGSISEEQLKYFLGIIKHEARNSKVYVIPWDAEAYNVLIAKRPADVAKNVAAKMKGGGGTVIKPVLKKTYKLMKRGDAVIVLTDGDIFDKEESETQRLFDIIAKKASFAMVGYTNTPVHAPGFYHTKIDFAKNKEGLRGA